MNAQICLEKLKLVGVLSFATVDATLGPQTRNISAIHYEPDALYFLTARGKPFAQQLLKEPRVQVLGYTRFKEMIRLSGKAMPVQEQEQKHWRDVIYQEQPYLENVYPGKTKQIDTIFVIRDFFIEYFMLGARPIQRERYVVGNVVIPPKGYRVKSEECQGCETCFEYCPQHTIALNDYGVAEIRQNNCLQCGACFEICPFDSIERL